MRWIFLLILVLLVSSGSMNAEILGEKFEDCAWSKIDEFGGPEKSETKSSFVYGVRYKKRDLGKVFAVFTVSKTTGIIRKVLFSNQFTDIHEAVAWAATLCEGKVSLPEEYHWRQGYSLAILPGEKYNASIWLSVNIRFEDLTGRFSVEADLGPELDDMDEWTREHTMNILRGGASKYWLEHWRKKKGFGL